MKVGSSAPKKTDARFVTATHANLERMVERGTVSPGLILSAERVLGSFASFEGAQGGYPAPYRPFPGGKRREHPAGRACCPNGIRLSRQCPRIAFSHTLCIDHRQWLPPIARISLLCLLRNPRIVTRQIVDNNNLLLSHAEKAHIMSVYDLAGRNKAAAAKMLGIGLSTLHRKIKEYDID